MESAELIRLRDEYRRKIEEIDKEHFEGIAPLIARMKVSWCVYCIDFKHWEALIMWEKNCLHESDDLQCACSVHNKDKIQILNLETLKGVFYF